jgi:hypothetical protein
MQCSELPVDKGGLAAAVQKLVFPAAVVVVVIVVVVVVGKLEIRGGLQTGVRGGDNLNIRELHERSNSGRGHFEHKSLEF